MPVSEETGVEMHLEADFSPVDFAAISWHAFLIQGSR